MIIDFKGNGQGGEDPRVDQLIKDVAKKQDKLNNITEIPDEAIFVGKLNDEGQPIGGVVAVAEDGFVEIEASAFSVGKDGETYISVNGEGVGLNGNVTVNGSTVLTEASVKTINGESIVGEGDIEIKGGGADIKAGEGIFITEDSEGAKVISTSMPKNEIWYTSTTSGVVVPRYTSGYGANIISNTYVGGNGVVKFDGNITTIPISAYTSASTLTSISIPDSVTSIGNNAFSNCSKLKSVTIPDSVTTIGSAVFYSCSGLTSVEIGSGVTSIATSVFSGCRSLKSVTIPDSVKTINNYTFSGCTSLTSVTIPDSVTSIGTSAFQYCSGLKSVTIPDSVKTIANATFNQCSGLTSVEIGSGVTSVGNDAFKNVPTRGTLYCDEEWYNNLNSTNITNLGNVYNWTKVWTTKPLDERVDKLVTDVNTISGNVETLNEKVDDLQLYKFPNATIFGEPRIDNGQVSNFSVDNYLQFPFIVDFKGRSFELEFSFTTGPDVSQVRQYNIFDSNYGLAFAVRNRHFVLAYSTNGTSWNNEFVSTNDIGEDETYYVKIGWDSEARYFYSSYSRDKETYIDWVGESSTDAPYPRTIMIGRSWDGSNYFNGSINLNDAYLTIANKVVWQGMDDVGLATRASVSLDNINEDGFMMIAAVANEGIQLKTINGEELKGEGDIEIKGGSYQYVNEDTESKQLMLGDIPSEGDPMAGMAIDGNNGDVQILGMQSISLLGGNVNISNLDETSSISVSDGGVNIVGSANINEAPIVVQENFSYDPITKTLSIDFI